MKHTRTLISYLGSLLLALVLASIIWLNATQVQDPITTQFLQLDVNFVGQPENSILVEPDKQSVQIRIEGPQSALNQISLADFYRIGACLLFCLFSPALPVGRGRQVDGRI